MKECDKAALFKRHPGCHPDCDFLQGYLVAADELLVNIWKYDKTRGWTELHVTDSLILSSPHIGAVIVELRRI